MPMIDGTVLSQSSNHSASIKVVARLAYILTLYLLNNYLSDTKINNMQYIINEVFPEQTAYFIDNLSDESKLLKKCHTN